LTPNGSPCALKLRRALCGTKQASRMWQLKLHLVDKMGFVHSTHDPCLFSTRIDGVLVVGVYVDGIIVAHNGIKHLEWFTNEFTGQNCFRAKC